MYYFFFFIEHTTNIQKLIEGKNISNIIQYRNLSEETNVNKKQNRKRGNLPTIHAKNTYFPITWRDHENTNRKKEARP